MTDFTLFPNVKLTTVANGGRIFSWLLAQPSDRTVRSKLTSFVHYWGGSPVAVAHSVLQCCCTFHTTENYMAVFFISFTTFRADFTSHPVNQSNKTYLLSCQVAGLLGLLESQEEAHYFGK